MAETLLRPSQIAKRYGITPNTIRGWIRTGRLEAVQTLGGHYRLSAEAVDQALGVVPAQAAGAVEG